MNESVESEALVMPSSSGSALRRLAVFVDHAAVFVLVTETVNLFFEQELGIADVLDPHPAQHLANDHFDMLIVDVHALQTINFLNFVDQVFLQTLRYRARAECRAGSAGRPSAVRPI